MSQQINLYEDRLRPRHELASSANFLICTLLVLGLMTGLSLWTRLDANRKSEAAAVVQKQLADEQIQLTALAKAVAERKVTPSITADIEVSKTMLAARKEVVAVLDSGKLGNSTGFSEVMAGFARQAQNDLWLTGFTVSMGGAEIEIHGRMLDPAKLPGYVQRLSGEPQFQGRRFAALEMRGVDPDEVKVDPTKVAQAVDQGKQAVPVPSLPRYVEFVLRSENVGENVAKTGASQ